MKPVYEQHKIAPEVVQNHASRLTLYLLVVCQSLHHPLHHHTVPFPFYSHFRRHHQSVHPESLQFLMYIIGWWSCISRRGAALAANWSEGTVNDERNAYGLNRLLFYLFNGSSSPSYGDVIIKATLT
ncbi:hypothetical protein DICVIV_09819 [Dictyocaulus viviparus]|uniref:Uncharacterized protein n=1 Tax=Dictyocaulus viviparus TaxID=29172 RepID=A0A0D8XP55_DICVI|nr:hypothetical protein DICVIV_09819 [Dictyocaulus viviparus]